MDDEIKTPSRILELAELAGLALGHGVPFKKVVPSLDAIVDLIDGMSVGTASGPGKRPRAASYRIALGVLCAAVTVLKNGRGVEAAIAEIATKSGYTRKEISNFRGRINRGRTDDLSLRFYNKYVAIFERMTEAEIFAYICT